MARIAGSIMIAEIGRKGSEGRDRKAGILGK
jgi:hypothetical protein